MAITYYPCDTLYVDKINGKYTAYTYGDGSRYIVIKNVELYRIERYAQKYHFKIINIERRF